MTRAALICFAGPSLPDPPDAARARIDFRPPARCGDLLRAALEKPFAIGLVDGAFETAPAVWHKEILFALSEGVAVYGAASMGALRAAECAAFGMAGVGAVFAAFRDGAPTDDDEVAVQHGPAETGYVALNEAMVDMRATLEAAAKAGVVTAQEAQAVAAAAKALFYKDRVWDAALAAAALPVAAATRLAAFVATSAVSVKRGDAQALVEALLAHDVGRWRRPIFDFARTRFFDDLRRRVAP